MKKEDQIKMAEQGWHNFTKATTYAIGAVIVVLLLMALFLL